MLSVKERRVLRLIADGLSNAEIASELSIALRTVEHRRACVMKKLDVKSGIGLLHFALAAGEIGRRFLDPCLAEL
jgi:DNA-binding NarL/FixJ family response regulator